MGKIIRAISPNAGIRARYRRELLDLVDEMQRSVVWWVRAAWRKESVFAQDANPVSRMSGVIARLYRHWLSRFSERASRIADRFVNNSEEQTESSYRQAFKQAGFTVKMKPTRVTNAVVQALIKENKNLIEWVPVKYFHGLEDIVTNAMISGRDIHYIVEELKTKYNQTAKMADFIARDQANKAVQAIKRVEGERLGVRVGIWVHVPGRKYIRHSHKAMDGKPFLLSEGMYDPEVKRNVQPGELWLCQCTYRDFVPAFGDKVTPEIEALLKKEDKPTAVVPEIGVGRKGLLLKENWHEKK